MGQGPGLSNYSIGEQTGTETVTLNTNQIPKHNHMMLANSNDANLTSPGGNMPAAAQEPFYRALDSARQSHGRSN